MKRVFLVIHVAIMFACFALLMGVARAMQVDLPDPVFDPEAWATSAAALAAAVLVIVAFIKKQLGLKGTIVLVVSFGLAEVGSVTLYFLDYIDTLQGAIIHGLSAGLLASGGWDALKGLFGGGGGSTPSAGASLPR